MKVYELTTKVFLKNDLEFIEVPEKIYRYVSMYLAKSDEYLDFHRANIYKPYVLDYLYPIEKDGVYKKEEIYSFRIRTIDQNLANYFLEGLDNFQNDDMKGLVLKAKTIPKKHITRVFTLTPVIYKNDGGYWRGIMDIEQFEARLNGNLFKKYKHFIGDVDKEEKFYKSIKFLNRKPFKVRVKGVDLLGDKLELEIKDDNFSQDLAYLALGISFSENSTMCCGFLGYKYLE